MLSLSFRCKTQKSFLELYNWLQKSIGLLVYFNDKAVLFKRRIIMENKEFYISMVMSYGYSREEAINILNSKNPNRSNFIELPF